MKVLFLILIFFVTSCFETYRKNDSIQNVRVIPSRQDENLFIIKKDLEDRFGVTSNPDYNLYVSIAKTSAAGGLTSEAYSTSFTLIVSAKFTLFDLKEKKNIYSGAVSKSTNYVSESGKLVAEKVGEKVAFETLSKQVSLEIYDQIQDRFLDASPSR